MNTSVIKPPTWFWIVSVILLLWNLTGVMAFFMEVTMTPQTIQAMPEAERHLHMNTPLWIFVIFAVAVFGDTLGSILLLLRKKSATPVFIVSLIFTMVQMFYTLFITDLIAINGAGRAVLPVVIVLVGFFLIWFSRMSAAKGWLK